ncbi:hypothetical protein [Agrobacterium vitis]|uniref:hypothetical protein n=1 Tax=Agrobacterium vitis TaxID=373 RepID=UPI002035A476|nr:hypothetical protein [Agrobacterium vitis]MCM2453659.1 hypothetical protein [Agrobacterium vitis]
MTASDTPPIWKSFCAALGADYREHQEIQGISGLTHPVQAVAVDEKDKRVIVVSAEYTPRVAALMRVDIQATMPDVKVLVARPLAIDLAHASRLLFSDSKGGRDFGKVSELAGIFQTLQGKQNEETNNVLSEKFGPALFPIFNSVKRSDLPLRSHILHTIEQAVAMNWESVKGRQYSDMVPLALHIVDMFRSVDNLAADRAQGVCPVPTYELTDSDWTMFERGKNIEEIRERLKSLDIYQYFYPPADSLAMGLIDEGLGSNEDIIKSMSIAKSEGHQLSENELLPDITEVPDILDEFQARGYAVEGEASWELTPEGKTMRQSIKFRPRESLISKIVSRFSVSASLDLKDIFPPK